ncbi:MAG: TolC family protein [SAR324 cluster bacterium]|nr:TolC family protein [SAR324 cluster bacterium]
MQFPGLEIQEYGERSVVKSSLKTTLHLVIRYNTTLKSARQGEAIAESALLAVKERFNPSLDNAFSVSRSTSASSSFSDESAPYLNFGQNNTQAFSSKLSKKTSNGISYSATFAGSSSYNRTLRINEKGADPEDLGKSDDPLRSTSLTLGMSIPIFQDWGEVNDIPVSRGQVRLENSQVNTRRVTLQILETFSRIYWDLAGLWKTRQVLLETIKVSEQLVEQNLLRVRYGQLNSLDLKQSQIQLYRSQNDLLELDNRIRAVEDQVKVALNLKTLPYGFLPGDSPNFRKIPFNFNQQLEKIYRNSVDINTLQSNLKSIQLDLENAYNKNQPDLDLNLSYTLKGADKEFSETFDIYDQSELSGYQVGLTWSVPLFDYQTEELIKQKNLERSQLDIELSLKKDELYVDLKTIQRNLHFAEQDIKNSITIRELAEEMLKQEIEKNKLGQSTSYQVSQAQQDLTASQSKEIQSLINFEKIHLSLLVLTGDIFDQFQIPR